jgi:hypothetical protein
MQGENARTKIKLQAHRELTQNAVVVTQNAVAITWYAVAVAVAVFFHPECRGDHSGAEAQA